MRMIDFDCRKMRPDLVIVFTDVSARKIDHPMLRRTGESYDFQGRVIRLWSGHRIRTSSEFPIRKTDKLFFVTNKMLEAGWKPRYYTNREFDLLCVLALGWRVYWQVRENRRTH